MTEAEIYARETIHKKGIGIKNAILFAMLLSGAITAIIFIISVISEIFIRDPLLLRAGEGTYWPNWALVKILCYIAIAIFLFLYIPLKLGIQEQIIPKRSGIVLVIILTYLISSVSLAVFLSLTTQIVDYGKIPGENPHRDELLDNGVPCYFNFKESFFDAVSGFTTTGLTAFRTKYEDDNGIEKEMRKIDVQPRLIHIIRATYLWIGGLGIMFFYLYFTPVPSLMMSLGYEIPAERSLPRFIRLEGLSFSLVYVFITVLGILLLFISISNASQSSKVDMEDKLTYSVILSFSSISTGGFSPGSSSVDDLQIEAVEYQRISERIKLEDFLIRDRKEIEKHYKSPKFRKDNRIDRKVNRIPIINNWGLLVIMGLMFTGAMPIFTLHRPLKFFRKWKIFVVFLLPILGYALFSYAEDPQLSFNRAFDAVSAFTTTGLFTSQFEEDFDMPSDSMYMIRDDKNIVERIYQYRFRSIYMIVLMFIGGAAYSTAGGWGFFSFFCSFYAIYLIITGKLEQVLTRYILQLILSFMIFFAIFAVGTFLCYESGLFGTFSEPESAAVTEYVINSAFYEISALSTVGLMPDSMIQSDGIYYHDLAYWTLAVSMLIGRLFYIIFPFLVSLSDSTEEI